MDGDIIVLTESRPTRADAVKNRMLLLETARRLFNEQGVDAVSMSAVAEAAGVGKGTLYRHFTNKTELCLSLLDADQRELQENTLRRLREIQDPYDNLTWFVEQAAIYVDVHINWLSLGVLATGESTLEHPAHLWWRQTILSLLGQLRPGGDVDYMADVLYVMLSVHAIEFQRHALGYSRERVVRGLLETLERLLC